VAILSILSFERRFPVQSQTVVQTLISDARVAGKTKMTIDLSGNGGGDISLGYDLSRQFFPKIV
jgi:C-terminal processing protease CtpA/Prc